MLNKVIVKNRNPVKCQIKTDMTLHQHKYSLASVVRKSMYSAKSCNKTR